MTNLLVNQHEALKSVFKTPQFHMKRIARLCDAHITQAIIAMTFLRLYCAALLCSIMNFFMSSADNNHM